jgi:hypothetical protein
MTAPLEVDIHKLANRLGGALPSAYRDLVQSEDASSLAQRGFDPKTLLVLNLRLRVWEHIDSEGKFFLNGDGCGNYYFTQLTANAEGVLLWSHDPPGIEDPGFTLASYLREAEQLCRIDWPPQPGRLYICRSPTYGESILNPIGLDEWITAIGSTTGIAHVGFREGRNPFTGETIRIEIPGLAITSGSNRADVQFHDGRAELEETPAHRAIAEQLARFLGAQVQPTA